ncbi:MAG: hypothetical protein PHQ23_03780 [Candidatus Wallbacteria bacterium]|nr:hypothetical protein [Candidatus Wallbacteria bacterium]
MSVDEFLKELEDKKLICPQPDKWNELYELLPDKHRKGNGWIPPLPLILNGWWYSNDQEKKMRLREHLEYAEKKGVLNEVIDFLSNLRPEDWKSSD